MPGRSGPLASAFIPRRSKARHVAHAGIAMRKVPLAVFGRLGHGAGLPRQRIYRYSSTGTMRKRFLQKRPRPAF